MNYVFYRFSIIKLVKCKLCIEGTYSLKIEATVRWLLGTFRIFRHVIINCCLFPCNEYVYIYWIFSVRFSPVPVLITVLSSLSNFYILNFLSQRMKKFKMFWDTFRRILRVGCLLRVLVSLFRIKTHLM